MRGGRKPSHANLTSTSVWAIGQGNRIQSGIQGALYVLLESPLFDLSQIHLPRASMRNRSMPIAT